MNNSLDIQIEELSGSHDWAGGLARDVRAGLAREPKELPPKYFYDERGSQLFEEICELPEYYQTRTERAMLQALAPSLVARLGVSSLVELGSGSSTKTRVILDAMRAAGTLRQYMPIDISREMLLESAERLAAEYHALEVRAVIADFTEELPRLSGEERSLVIFLGGTIGNFRQHDAIAFLSRVASCMTEEDHFLLGVDLVKPASMLHAAYNDSRGVTAQFNLNVLHVVNRELGGNFDLDGFEHYAFYDPAEEQIEMHLSSLRDQTARIERLDMTVEIERGETILTEISRKFTHRTTEELLASSGMTLEEFHTDAERRFGLAVARTTSG